MNSIIFSHVTKKYMLSNERPLLLKTLFQQKSNKKNAISNLSFSVRKGDTIGIIGRNGSGKSTILKLIARILSPTSGTVQINGRVSSLIELGAGFHPDLSGRENVYLNGLLLGISKKEIKEKYQSIIDFADIGNYIDQPIRNYSSGMIVRLGFAVAIHSNPDILLIDEVLAVGDEQFQRKCLSKMNEIKQEGKTILLVSHSLSMLKSFSSKAIYIQDGKIAYSGNPRVAIDKYLLSIDSLHNTNLKTNVSTQSKNKGPAIRYVSVGGKLRKKTVFERDENIYIECVYENITQVDKPVLGISLFNALGSYIFGTNTKIDHIDWNPSHSNKIRIVLEGSQLLPGNYFISVGICRDDNWNDIIDQIINAAQFNIKKRTELPLEGIVELKREWIH